jgi:hypothetical protein
MYYRATITLAVAIELLLSRKNFNFSMLPFRKIINVIVSTFRPPTTIIWVNACFVGHRYPTFKSLSATYDTPSITVIVSGTIIEILATETLKL